MAVRGTTSFVYFTDQSLGSGATGNVFFGRHKRKGTPCAVKSFRADVSAKEMQTREREFEVMRRLNHENIVRFISIEPESQGNDRVLIMELCTGGSLFKILEEPENAFGFDEEEFVIFLRDITQALQYMRREKIVHRDIKPGNILRHIKDDSGSVYKLTDFGAARELRHGDEEFMSLCGTEEYLHPAVFERALLAGQRGSFNASIDLWSLGVTIYHVASGHLPFQSHGGRKNREDMYRIISQKGPGMISGIQHSKNADITWSRDLPASCRLSRGLKKYLVPMLTGLLESNARTQCTFDQFFSMSDDLTLRPVLHVFCPSTCRQERLYVGADERSSEAHLRDALAELTELPDARHRYIHESLSLSDLLVVDTMSRQITFMDSPFYVVPLTASVNEAWTRVLSDIVSYPDSPVSSSSGGSSSNLAEDAAGARATCAYTIYMTRHVDQLNRVQAHIFKIVNQLHRSLTSSSQEMQASLQTLLFINQSLMEVTTDNSRLTRLQERQLQLSSIASRVFKCSPPSVFIRTSNSCQRNLCHKTMKKCVTELRLIHDSFKDQKKKVLSYNDEQIHKFDRLRISEIVKRASAQYNRCLSTTDKLLKQFHEWFCIYTKDQDSIDHIDIVEDCQEEITINLSELKQMRPQYTSLNDIGCQTIDVTELGIAGINWRHDQYAMSEVDIQVVHGANVSLRSSIISRKSEGATNWNGDSKFVNSDRAIGRDYGMDVTESSLDSAYNSRSTPNHGGSPRITDGNRFGTSDVIKLREDVDISRGARTVELVSRGCEYEETIMGGAQADNMRRIPGRRRLTSASRVDDASSYPAIQRTFDIKQQLSQLNRMLHKNETILSSAQLETENNSRLLDRLRYCQPDDDHHDE